MVSTHPYSIDFQTIGDPAQGYISISEFEKNLPFVPQRVFWTYFTPNAVIRGRHAHYATEMVLIPVCGRIELTTECIDGRCDTFVLESPATGIYLPPLCWHTMQYSHNAVQLIFASTPYDAADYIRDFDTFKALQQS
jgi:WxcM-like, C-terminal